MTTHNVPKEEFIHSGFIVIWLNTFFSAQESLEICFDALAPYLNNVSTPLGVLNLFDFLAFLRGQKISAARLHLPVSGDLDGLLDTGPYLDLALESGEAISLIGARNFALVKGDAWELHEIQKIPIKPVMNWKELDLIFAEFISQVSNEIEAFDLVSSDPSARELLIKLDHNLGYLQFPQNQPQRITLLLGRLMRTWVIGQLANNNYAHSATLVKDQQYKGKIEELITKSRSFLSQVCNYHLI